ncbi:hypothetical protein [Sphingomonas turrisvirgatae]|uniref:Uncharacterized protein n=1 Tax=Sphingomonas turrisvirgatae TaxID=1888892 RepID=A0A1E3LZA3_9SPHN|nr:hypothetical protein [Sphingomonas turrisvirgatae]ODP38120.1 hypothetical protein BFL28_15450 [Sphingomonas turrisvirgatae]
MDESRKWLNDFHTKRRPRAGETARQHLERTYVHWYEAEYISAHDFWRVGIILSVDQSVREQVSRQRFLDLRKACTGGICVLVQTDPVGRDAAEMPGRAYELANFTLICADGKLVTLPSR